MYSLFFFSTGDCAMAGCMRYCVLRRLQTGGGGQ